MQLGMIGLGRMGGNMAKRLQRAGHEVVPLDLDVNKIAELEKEEGMKGATNIPQFVQMLRKPRVAWLMVPSGDATEGMVNKLAAVFEPGDILIDGGNSFFKDDVRRAEALKAKGIHYCDVGTSGGVWGLERGYCLMAGAEKEIFAHLESIFKTLAPGQGNVTPTVGMAAGSTASQGYLHCGPVGAGHFVKMVHNGIEYGLMQAYGEGFDIMKNANSTQLPENIRYNLNLGDIAELWRRGSVVSSWLLDLSAIALAEDPKLESYTGYVQDSGEGRWTIMAALEESVPAEVLAASLYVRFRSRQEHTFAEKMLSAMRKQFGGHLERPAGG